MDRNPNHSSTMSNSGQGKTQETDPYDSPYGFDMSGMSEGDLASSEAMLYPDEPASNAATPRKETKNMAEVQLGDIDYMFPSEEKSSTPSEKEPSVPEESNMGLDLGVPCTVNLDAPNMIEEASKQNTQMMESTDGMESQMYEQPADTECADCDEESEMVPQTPEIAPSVQFEEETEPEMAVPENAPPAPETAIEAESEVVVPKSAPPAPMQAVTQEIAAVTKEVAPPTPMQAVTQDPVANTEEVDVNVQMPSAVDHVENPQK